MKSPIKQSRRTRGRHSERGVSVVEGLVAIVIFGVVFLAALMLYSSANRAYLSTDSSTIQQQNVRFAMDRMGETLRDAGANFNPLGSRTLPDEQVEGAWQSAIVVRGDFNNSRETPLESTDFYPIVTVNNEEIVAYVLRKAVPATGADPNSISLTVKADFRGGAGGSSSTTRDATISGTTINDEETATIMVAATTLAEQTDPPYQLTRVTFPNGAPKYDVIADNIFRLSFDYRAADGTPAVTTFGSADAQRAQRAAIRRVDVNLIGMTDRPDLGYTDPNTYNPPEGATTRNRRKFALSEQIVMPNMGVIGRRHMTVPPLIVAAPPSITVCTGHCRNFHISWSPSPTAGVSQYTLRISAPAAGSQPAFTEEVSVNDIEYDYEQPDAEVRAYTFSVAAMVSGTTGTFSQTLTTIATHDTTNSVPSAVTAVTPAAITGRQALGLSWPEVTTNISALTGSTCQTVGDGAGLSAPPAPWNINAVDLALDDQEGVQIGTSYKVYRVRYTGGNTGAFTPAAANQVDTQQIGDITNVAPTGGSFTDNTAAACSQYFYKVQACDLCGINGDFSPAMTTPAYYRPAAGVRPQAPTALLLNGTMTTSGGNYNLQLTWPHVTRTTNGEPAVVSHYILERWRKLANEAAFTLQTTSDATSPIYDTNVSATESVPVTVGGVSAFYRYYVRAQYDCGTFAGDTNRTSDQSPAYDLSCVPPGGNSITFASPTAGTSLSRPYEYQVPIRATTSGNAWTSAEVLITGPGGTVYSQSVVGPPVLNTYTFPTWDTTGVPDGEYLIQLVGLAGACRSVVQTRSVLLETNTCGLEIINAQFRGNGGNTATSMTFNIRNTCDGANITLNGLTAIWSGAPTARITAISGAANYYSNNTGATSGASMAFNVPTSVAPNTLTINALQTSALLTFTFTDNFTSDGTRNGTFGAFSSIRARVTAPSSSIDELVSGSQVP